MNGLRWIYNYEIQLRSDKDTSPKRLPKCAKDRLFDGWCVTLRHPTGTKA